MKHHLEQQGQLSAKERAEWFSCAAQVKDWQAQLHFLQSLSYLAIRAQDKPVLLPLLQQWLTSDNKFVRAWVYSGFVELAVVCPALQAEVDKLITAALQSESPAVKARLRQLSKRFGLAP